MGELQAIENIHLPRMQRLGRIIFGFPLPFLPVGIGGILPIPRRTQMTWAIGKPIQTKSENPGNPTMEEVDRFHREYFTALKNLIDSHKEHLGFGEFTVKINGVDI